MKIPQKWGELWKAAKFAVVGVANTLVDVGVFALLSQLLGVNRYLANAISYGAGMLNSYIWNRSWTFKTRQKFWSPTLLRFVVVNLAMFGLSTGLLWLCAGQLGFHELVAKGISVVITMGVNFVISRLWVFSS